MCGDDSIRDFFYDLSKYIPGYLIPGAVNLCAIPIYSRLFNPQEYGNYILILNAAIILSSVITGWISTSTVRFYEKYRLKSRLEEFENGIIKITLLIIILCLFVIIILMYLAFQIIPPSAYLLFFFGLTLVFSSCIYDVLMSVLIAKRNINIYSGIKIGESVTTLLMSLILIVQLKFHIEGVLIANILSKNFFSLLLFKYSSMKISIENSSFLYELFIELANYGFPLIFVNLSSWLILISDRYVIGILRNSYEVGIYSAGCMLVEQSILFIVILISLVSNPITFSIWEHKGAIAAKVFLEKIGRYYLIICFPATIGMSFLARKFMAIIVAPEYFEGYKVIPIIALSFFLIGLTNRYSTVLTLYKKTNIIMYSNFISLILNFGLNVLFVPKYGYIAAAFTTLAACALDLLLKIFSSRRYLIWKFPFKSLLNISFASSIMCISILKCTYDLKSDSIIFLICYILIGAGIYFTSLLLLKEFNQEETSEAIMFIKRIISREFR